MLVGKQSLMAAGREASLLLTHGNWRPSWLHSQSDEFSRCRRQKFSYGVNTNFPKTFAAIRS
jgi:hypothetical protein